MLDWLFYLAVGKVLIFLWQRFPLPSVNKTLTYLHGCDLCSGTWIYFLLAFLIRVDFVQLMGFGVHYPVVSQFVTGGISSFVMWLLSAGWKSKFDIVVLR